MVYHQIKFGYKKFSGSVDVIETLILDDMSPQSLWPWTWRQQTNLLAWHSGPWCCITIPSLVTQGSEFQWMFIWTMISPQLQTCYQTWFDDATSWAKVSCKKIGLLSSSSGSEWRRLVCCLQVRGQSEGSFDQRWLFLPYPQCCWSVCDQVELYGTTSQAGVSCVKMSFFVFF